jgi:hypothetical protein
MSEYGLGILRVQQIILRIYPDDRIGMSAFSVFGALQPRRWPLLVGSLHSFLTFPYAHSDRVKYGFDDANIRHMLSHTQECTSGPAFASISWRFRLFHARNQCSLLRHHYAFPHSLVSSDDQRLQEKSLSKCKKKT